MTKSESSARLAGRYPQQVAKEAEVVVKTMLDAMTATLAMGQQIEIRGFGSFRINHRLPRTGRNPKTDEKLPVPEKFVPRCKAGKELRYPVNS